MPSLSGVFFQKGFVISTPCLMKSETSTISFGLSFWFNTPANSWSLLTVSAPNLHPVSIRLITFPPNFSQYRTSGHLFIVIVDYVINFFRSDPSPIPLPIANRILLKACVFIPEKVFIKTS